MTEKEKTSYIARMAEIYGRRAQVTRKAIAETKEKLKQLELELGDIQNLCPHKDTKHHPRQIAEEDSVDECLACGKIT